jgi:RNase P subunit RPR2
MRIIKHGDIGDTYKSSCKNCGCLVELTASDVRFVADPRDGNAIVWKCPDCNEETWVSTNVVPQAFMRGVQK